MSNVISVIVPVYNAEEYLPRCIESILQQTHGNLELILVDDGSTDRSLAICTKYGNKDSRIRVIGKPNEGVSSARNLGIKEAKGEYIGFVDSDDSVDRDMYKALLDQLKADNTQVCVMTSYTVNKRNRELDDCRIVDRDIALKELLMLKFPTSLWAYLYARSLLDDLYMNEKLHFFEDFEFNYRVLSRSANVSLCHQRLYHYQPGAGSINMQRINERRMSCLGIYDLVAGSLMEEHSDLMQYASCFRAHMLVSVISSLARSENASGHYHKVVERHARSTLPNIAFSHWTPMRHKLAIAACSVNSQCACRLIGWLKR